jgi:AcrR family transcriptional regulator
LARPRTITNERILAAAREVFLAEGFSGTTSDIAARAEVSEGTIFKRFQTKEGLFLAALELDYPPGWHRVLRQVSGAGDPLESLRTLCCSIIQDFADMLPRMIAVMGNRPGHLTHEVLRTMPEPLPLRDLNVLRAYLDREVELGRMRYCDTTALAHVIMGALSQYPMHALIAQHQPSPEDLRAFACSIADLLWPGIRPT